MPGSGVHARLPPAAPLFCFLAEQLDWVTPAHSAGVLGSGTGRGPRGGAGLACDLPLCLSAHGPQCGITGQTPPRAQTPRGSRGRRRWRSTRTASPRATSLKRQGLSRVFPRVNLQRRDSLSDFNTRANAPRGPPRHIRTKTTVDLKDGLVLGSRPEHGDQRQRPQDTQASCQPRRPAFLLSPSQASAKVKGMTPHPP